MSSRSFLLYFNGQFIGSTGPMLYGLGWTSGFFDPSPTFTNYKAFFEELEKAEENSEGVISELEKKYGPEVLNPRNWKMKDLFGQGIQSTLPFISGGMISWKAT